MDLIIFIASLGIVIYLINILVDLVSYGILKLFFLYLPVSLIFIVLFIHKIAPDKFYEIGKISGMKVVKDDAPTWFRVSTMVARGYCVGSILGFLLAMKLHV